MAKLTIDQRHEEFAQALERAVHDREVKLTPHARMVLRLSAEAWIEEGPKLKPVLGSSPSPRLNPLPRAAEAIVDAAMDEQHVVKHRQQFREVPSHILIYALAVKAKKVLKNILDKGI